MRESGKASDDERVCWRRPRTSWLDVDVVSLMRPRQGETNCFPKKPHGGVGEGMR